MPGNVFTARSCGNVEFINNQIVPLGHTGTGSLSKRGTVENFGVVVDPGLPGITVSGNGTNTQV